MERNFCFCTLALSRRYCFMAKKLAADLKQYAPKTLLLVYTDLPDEFKDQNNILAFKHSQQGIFFCNNDKRFVINKALSMFSTVIFLDADIRITDKLPEDIEFSPGITAKSFYNIAEAKINKERKHELGILKKLIDKMNLPLEDVNWICPYLFVITKDRGKEITFIEEWDKIARYIHLKAINSRYLQKEDGNLIGLAAAKVGLTVRSEEIEVLRKIIKHEFVTSRSREIETTLDKSYKFKLLFWKYKPWAGSPYRLSRELLIALKDFEFYFR